MLREGQLVNNRYTIVKTLKKTNIYTLYEAQDVKADMYCNLKVFTPPPGTLRRDAGERFAGQADMLRQMDHANFVRVKDYFVSGENYCLVIDHIEGEDLIYLQENFGRPGLPEEDVRELGIKITQVLSYIHSFNPPYVYKYLDMPCIIIRKLDKRLILSDFGIAEAIIREDGPPELFSSAKHMAPEGNRGVFRPESDIYSAGSILYTLLTGKTPEETGRTPIKKIIPNISNQLEYAISEAIKEVPEERFAGAEEMSDILAGSVLVKDDTIEILSLIEKLKSPVPLIREQAKKELTETKREQAIDILIKILSEEKDELKRILAIENLLLVRSPRGNKAIIETLGRDEAPEVREKAAGAIGILKDSNGIDFLIKALHDKERKVSFKAIWALGEFRDERVITEFQKLIASSEDQELRRQLKMTLSRAFPDAKITDAKDEEARKKEMAGNVNNVVSFITNWKVIAVVIVLVLVGFVVKTMVATGSLNIFKPELTKDMYLQRLSSIENKKDDCVKNFKDTLDKVYVKEEENINQGHCIEISNCEEKFASLKREFDTFSPPDEYKDLNDRVIGAIGIYEEACQYAYNVYDPVKLQKALSYDEVLKNIEGKIEEADKIIKDGIEEVK